MSNYLNHLRSISNPKTFQRKFDYFKYNYSRYLKYAKPSDVHILEIGPGMGECLAYLNSMGIKNIDTTDNDPEVLDYLKANFNLTDAFLAESVVDIENKLGSYDAIIMTQILEHISKDQYKPLLSVLIKHLKNGGKIIITVPNMANPFTICERYSDLTHVNAFTEISLKQLPDYCAIKDIEIILQGFHIPPFSFINLVRILFQKMLHGLILIASIVNGGTYSKILTPNITLILKKK